MEIVAPQIAIFFYLLRVDFLGLASGPVVKTSPSNAGDVGSVPDQGADIPHASVAKKLFFPQNVLGHIQERHLHV